MMNDNVVVLLETKFEAVMTTVLTTVGGEATPEIIPVSESKIKPEGRAPVVTEKVRKLLGVGGCGDILHSCSGGLLEPGFL